MDPTSLDQLLSATRGVPISAPLPAEPIRGVSLDSRTIRPGEVFWAVRGARTDGHQYLEAARERGAVAAVVERAVSSSLPQIQVGDTTAALGDFARWYRERMPGLVIGVTGSVGKTTTRHMIHSVLSAAHRGVESPGSFNNHFGVPLSLLQMQADDEFAVVEMGASAPGEILALGQLARHEIAVITAIAEAHLSGFGTLDRVQSSKAELIESLVPGGFAVLNGDNARLRTLAETLNVPVILCGAGAHNDVRIQFLAQDADGLKFRWSGRDLCLPAFGKHHLVSAAISIAIAREIGLDPAAIAEGLRRFVPVAGRCVPKRIGDLTVIDDTYNASPLSMAAACELLGEWPTAGRRVLVLGDMLELGIEAPRYHRELGRAIAASNVDFLIAHGEFASDIVEEAGRFGMPWHQIAECATQDLIQLTLDCWLRAGDVVLVKGSRGMRMEQVIEWLEQRSAGLGAPEDLARPLRACA